MLLSSNRMADGIFIARYFQPLALLWQKFADFQDCSFSNLGYMSLVLGKYPTLEICFNFYFNKKGYDFRHIPSQDFILESPAI